MESEEPEDKIFPLGKRKVSPQGGSFIVTLPNAWAKEIVAKKGFVNMDLDRETNQILIYP